MIKIVEIGLEKKEWDVDSNQYGIFLNRPNLYQGFKIVPDNKEINSVNLTLNEAETSVKGLSVITRITNFATGDKVPLNSYVKTNPLTLNPEIHLYEGDADPTDNDTLIVMVNSEIAMIRNNVNGDICSTFHNTKDDESFYGCILHTKKVVDTSADKVEEAPQDKMILRIQAREGDKYRFIQINDDEVLTSFIRKEDTVEFLEKEWNRQHERGRYFQVNDRGMRTNLLICPWDISDEALEEVINESAYNQKNDDHDPQTMVYRLSRKTNKKVITEGDKDKIHDLVFGKPRRRALTLYNCEVPPAFLKELKLLYVFKMDSDGSVRCQKSN